MPTIINEFEIIPPADSGNGGGGGAEAQTRGGPAQGAAGSESLQPGDVEEIIRHSLQRWLRVWAD